MYSRLDPIFKAGFRETEKLDTRVGIRQDDEREDPYKGSKHERREETDKKEDEAVVSVEALAGFLRGLMSSDDVSEYVPEDHLTDARQPAARAASAYQKMADRTQGGAHPPVKPGDNAQLSPQEKILITRLIGDLDYLSRRGVESLAIGNSESGLLEGFIEAAERAREAIS